MAIQPIQGLIIVDAKPVYAPIQNQAVLAFKPGAGVVPPIWWYWDGTENQWVEFNAGTTTMSNFPCTGHGVLTVTLNDSPSEPYFDYFSIDAYDANNFGISYGGEYQLDSDISLGDSLDVSSYPYAPPEPDRPVRSEFSASAKYIEICSILLHDNEDVDGEVDIVFDFDGFECLTHLEISLSCD